MSGAILALLDDPTAAPQLLAAAAPLAELCRHGDRCADCPFAAARKHHCQRRSPDETARGVVAGRGTCAVGQPLEIFRNWALRANGRAQLNDIEAVVTDAFARHGPAADFVVIERPLRRYRGAAWQAMLAALLETDRPVLVVPPNLDPQFGRRIAVAWRGDDRTIRAVLAAMRCLGDVAQLFVPAGQREGADPPQTPQIIVEHRVAADLLVLPIVGQGFGETLPGNAHELGADMIVMRAYAHDPVRRLVLGGLTRYMPTNCDLPLLMRH
jgi:nucleotide-binding universal stress UspA family protein